MRSPMKSLMRSPMRSTRRAAGWIAPWVLVALAACSSSDTVEGGAGGLPDAIPGLGGADAYLEPGEVDAAGPADTASSPDTGPSDTGGPDVPQDAGPRAPLDVTPEVDAPSPDACLDAACLQCRPCITDVDCDPTGEGAARCSIESATGRFCSVSCDGGAPCPGAQACDRAGWCVPWPGDECPCLPGFEAAPTVCRDGPCEALTTCGAPCPAAFAVPETCNGADDDCDGQTDEELGEIVCGLGECMHVLEKCTAGKPNVCDPKQGSTPETCNAKDDDCDGVTDEDLGTVPCGTGGCTHPVPACVSGGPGACLDPFAGASLETCNGIDDDCNGETDEALGTKPCGKGPCAHGVPACVDGAPGPCDPTEGATPETCNGVDDDCNGEVDEALPPAICGLGACAHEVTACMDGAPGPCDPLAGMSPETCNAKDDDCDGQTDEGLGTLPCGTGACAHEVPACDGGAPIVCIPTDGAKPEECNSVDDDCDGQTDEGLGTVTCGLGVCVNTVEACVGGVAQTCAPKAGGAETCNAKDDDCDGQTDESGCPCPSASDGGRTYLLCNSKVTWPVAKDNCAKAGPGYHLATIQSAAENAFVASAIAPIGTHSWWIGLTDSENEGTWKWVTGEAVAYGPPWAPGEPNNSGNEDCAIMDLGSAGAAWIDAGCYETFRYVCEHD